MAKLAIDSASLESLVINREIFIPNREIGRLSLLSKIGRSPAKSGDLEALRVAAEKVHSAWRTRNTASLKPGVHTNDFAPIHRLRALKLGHASLATVFRPGRLTLQPILRENLESPVLRYQPITTAVVTDACLNTRWHHGAYTSAVLRESLGLDRVVTVYEA